MKYDLWKEIEERLEDAIEDKEIVLMTDFQSFKKESATEATISMVKDYLKQKNTFSLSFLKDDEVTIHVAPNVCTLITAFPSNVVNDNFAHELTLFHGVISAKTQLDISFVLNAVPVGCFVRQGNWYAFKRIMSSPFYYHHKKFHHLFSDSKNIIEGEGEIQYIGHEPTIIDETFQRFFVTAKTN